MDLNIDAQLRKLQAGLAGESPGINLEEVLNDMLKMLRRIPELDEVWFQENASTIVQAAVKVKDIQSLKTSKKQEKEKAKAKTSIDISQLKLGNFGDFGDF
ncbi:MAG TPA: hypothetical protein PLJ29_10805 [Leptospiraceae bacterium]|nr:hypothetical protein [Leptospiraceae bacterium]